MDIPGIETVESKPSGRPTPAVMDPPFDIPRSTLNIEDKVRRNPLAWRGQFSPQLVEGLLRASGVTRGLVVDPFSGSGTVLVEAARLGHAAIGFEINPAAATLARVYELAGLSSAERGAEVARARRLAGRLLNSGPLFGEVVGMDLRGPFRELVLSEPQGPVRIIFEAALCLADYYSGPRTASELTSALNKVERAIGTLPPSSARVSVQMADARAMPLPSGSVDIVITSPPYINVFNYHQQYRASMEALGWDLLAVARAEIGSNRKNRGNRLLTVVQYFLDMGAALSEIRRILRQGAYAVIVIGRESNVRKTAFYNGDILKSLLRCTPGLTEQRQLERVFLNKFGQRIVEDVLVLRAEGGYAPFDPELGKRLAGEALAVARGTADPDTLSDFDEAIKAAPKVSPSPLFDRALAAERFFTSTSPASPSSLTAGVHAVSMPSPHLEKLNALLDNEKLPQADRGRVETARDRYFEWVKGLEEAKGGPAAILKRRVELLNEYKRYIDLDLIFDSEDDFLYRQKGQLKLDNSIIEEFLPWIARGDIIAKLPKDVSVGPTSCFAAVYFESTLAIPRPGAGLHVRTKAQDFAVSRRLHIKALHHPDFSDSTSVETFVAYVATEMKTNLDKTMFQEACATARDLKIAVPGSKYFLMIEWLDMTPISTAPTDIQQVLLLRKAKRLGSDVRKHFSTAAGRRKMRDQYAKYLTANPLRVEVFQMWLDCVSAAMTDAD